MPRSAVYRFGPFELDGAEYRLQRNGVEVPLQLKAFETLCILVERAGRLLTKDDLLRQLWPGTIVEENNLNKNISMLRKALGDCPDGLSYIETVRAWAIALPRRSSRSLPRPHVSDRP